MIFNRKTRENVVAVIQKGNCEVSEFDVYSIVSYMLVKNGIVEIILCYSLNLHKYEFIKKHTNTKVDFMWFI